MPRRNLSSCWIRMKRSGSPSLRHSSALRRARFLAETWACRVCSSETLQLGINYRDSSLSREENDFPAKIHAGDRAPTRPAASSMEHLPGCLTFSAGLISLSWPSVCAA